VTSVEDLHAQAARVGHVGAESAADAAVIAERYYGALLIHAVFSFFLDDQVRDFINLAHKETPARQVSMLLRADDVNLKEVVTEISEFSALLIGESQVSPNIAIGIRVQLINSFISDNLFYIGIAKFHITMQDVNAPIRRFIGTSGQRGRFGGKAPASFWQVQQSNRHLGSQRDLRTKSMKWTR
jgi:hypothetical protein